MGTVRLYSLDPRTTSCSHAGREYRRQADGSFLVDEVAVGPLCRTAGFTVAESAARAPPPPGPQVIAPMVVPDAAPAARDESGRFAKGSSGNPSGQPKWVREARAKAGESVAAMVALLVKVANNESEDTAVRVAAAKEVLGVAGCKPVALDGEVLEIKNAATDGAALLAAALARRVAAVGEGSPDRGALPSGS